VQGYIHVVYMHVNVCICKFTNVFVYMCIPKSIGLFPLFFSLCVNVHTGAYSCAHVCIFSVIISICHRNTTCSLSCIVPTDVCCVSALMAASLYVYMYIYIFYIRIHIHVYRVYTCGFIIYKHIYIHTYLYMYIYIYVYI